ncbi:MAG: cell division protein FtsL [Aestuariivirgaceae bacterium]
MILRLVNGLLVVGLLVSAYFVYALEHKTRSAEREIGLLNAQIRDERENIKLLTAEWSLLTRPDRIEHLAAKHLKLEVVGPMQRISESDIDTRVPAEPVIAPGTPGTDPIGDILRHHGSPRADDGRP